MSSFSRGVLFRRMMKPYAAISGLVNERVALLRAKLVFDAAASVGAEVSDLTFEVTRFCLVEPSYVVALAPPTPV